MSDRAFFEPLYAQQEQDAKDEELEQMIADRADELMKKDYNPFIKENIMEALCEFTDAQYEQIAQSYSSKLPLVAGSIIGGFIEEFWTDQALKEAKEQIEQEIKDAGEL